MALGDYTRQLCERLLACQDDREALALAEELRQALRSRMEKVRGDLIVLPPMGSEAEEA
jgi:hypothetical protein